MAIYSELAIVRKSAVTVCRDTKAGRKVGKLYSEKKGKASGMPLLEVVGMGKL